jgi:hypothetical protein
MSPLLPGVGPDEVHPNYNLSRHLTSLPVSPMIEITESHPTKSKTYRKGLGHPKGNSFTLRKIAAREPELEFWNLCALIDPRYPQSSDKGRPAVRRWKCTSIAIDFGSEEEANRFECHFKYIMKQRMEHIEQFKKGRMVPHAQSDKTRSSSGSNASISTTTVQ